MKYILIFISIVISIWAKTYDKLEFSGEGIDFLMGDFASSTLYKIIGKPYPPFYTPWRADPVFKDSEIDEYKRRLTDYFNSFGYYHVEINSTLHDNYIKIIITKNAPIKVRSLELNITDDLKPFIPFKVGSIFKTDPFSKSKKDIERYLLENGYPKHFLKAKAYVDIDKYEVNLSYHVDKNNSYKFGKSTISNIKDINKQILQEKITYKEGDIYDIRALEKTYDNFYESAIFDQILINPKFDKNSTIAPINIELKKGKTKFLKNSIGYNTDEGFRAEISWIDKNFFGNLKVLDTGIKATQIGYKAYNKFYNPRIIVPYIGKIDFENHIQYTNHRYDTFDEKTLTNRITIGKIALKLEHYFGILTEYSKIDTKTLNTLNEDGNYFINSFFYNLLVDKRDSKIDAKNGYYISLYLEKADKILKSELDYLKSLLELRYIKSFDNFTLGLKSRVGRIDENVPIFKRFFTGGSITNRGYEYLEVGLKDSANIPLGGVSLIDFMGELRYRIWQKLSMAIFYDSSMLSLVADKFDDTFYDSYGFGVRYITPIGPLRVDFGFPLDKDGFAFHISIGQVF